MVLKTKLENTVNMAAIPVNIIIIKIIIQFSNFITYTILPSLINQFEKLYQYFVCNDT